MDLKNKIIGVALASLVALIGFNLKETYNMRGEIMKLQQGQVVLFEKLKKVEKIIKKKNKKKNIILFFCGP